MTRPGQASGGKRGPRFHWTTEHLGLTAATPVHVGRVVHRRGTPRHDHDFWEFTLVLGGRARQYTDAAEATLSAGHALVIRPGAFHDYHDCGDLDLINGAVLPSLFARELGWIYEDARIGRLLQPPTAHPTNPWTIPLSPEAFSRCRGMLEPVVAGRGKPVPAGKAGMVGLLLRLLEELGVAAEAHYGAAAAVTPVVRRAARLLEDDLARAWRMADLAAALNVSAGHLSRQFSAGLGLPPMAFLARLRAEAAAALLRRTDLPVAEIGRRVGYARADYFIPRFRAVFGVAPGVYRAAARR